MPHMTWNGFPNEISEFCEALRQVAATERTADALTGLSGAFASTWRKNRTVSSGTSGVPIPPPRNKAIFPQACAIEEAELSFIFMLGDSIEEELLPARCDFQVRVRGTAMYSNDVYFELEDHWRVDTHIERLDNSAEDREPNEPHPKIHFQRGGHAQDTFAGHQLFVPGEHLPLHADGPWQSLLQSPGPRVPFPPFCPVLAIDYAIGQHDGSVLRRLRALPEYSTIVRRAQERLWDPFFASLASNPAFRKRWLGGMFL